MGLEPRPACAKLTAFTIDVQVGDVPVGDVPVGDVPVGDVPVGDVPVTARFAARPYVPGGDQCR